MNYVDMEKEFGYNGTEGTLCETCKYKVEVSAKTENWFHHGCLAIGIEDVEDKVKIHNGNSTTGWLSHNIAMRASYGVWVQDVFSCKRYERRAA